MMRLILIVISIFIIYYLFFRKKVRDDNKNESITMVECHKCGCFINKDEALINNGKYFCNNNCIES